MKMLRRKVVAACGPVVLMVSVEVCAVLVVIAIEAGLKAHVGAGVAVGVIALQESAIVPV